MTDIDFSKYSGAQDLPDTRDFRSEELVGALPIIALPDRVMLDQTPYLNQGSRGACHDSLTEVLTEDGWKYFSDITQEDKLGTVNPETSELYFEQPTNIISYHFQGNMFFGKHNKLNFMVTPNHKMLVKRWDSKNNKLSNSFEFVEAQELGWYSGFMNRIKNTKKGNDYYTIPGVDNKTNSSQRIDKIISMDIWLMFLGIFIAEGTLCFDEKRKQYKVQIAGVKDREREFIMNILDDIGVQYTSLKDRFTFNDKRIFTELSKWFLGAKAPYKRVPKFIFQESANNIKSFLLGHFMGDGTFSTGRNVHYTSSEGLADDLFTLIFLSGESPYIRSTKPRVGGLIQGRQIIGKHTSYAISENAKNTVALDKQEHLSVQHYDGMVYCAEVPTYHTLVTRREGTILISGNCTVFGSSGAWFETLSQIMTSINEKYTQPFDPWTVWDEALKRGASDTNGWYIQSALQLLTDLGLIGGYVKIGDYGSADAYTMQYWVNKGFGVVTGSAKGDWGKVVSTGRYSEQKGKAGHCFYQNGYDKNLESKLHLHFPNSWNGTGDFWLDFDTYGKRLFTQYIIIETKDVALIKEIKGKRRADALVKAREYKLWNEQRPLDIASDTEITTMIHRALGLSIDFVNRAIDSSESGVTSIKTRAWYANIFQKKILQGKANLPIWNQKDGLKKATPLEVATMFTRASRRDSSAKSGIMIREDVAVIVARDLIA